MKAFFLSALILASSTTAHATEPKACLLEGQMKLGAMTLQISDCWAANAGTPYAQLQKACDQTAGMAKAMGGAVSTTYMASCPPKPQAGCINLKRPASGFSAFYYKRSPSQLATTKRSCAINGGTWKDAP